MIQEMSQSHWENMLCLLPFLPFTIEYILNAGLGDYGIITFEPLVFVLTNEAGVVATLQSALVVDHRKQGIPGNETKWRGMMSRINVFWHFDVCPCSVVSFIQVCNKSSLSFLYMSALICLKPHASAFFGTFYTHRLKLQFEHIYHKQPVNDIKMIHFQQISQKIKAIVSATDEKTK